MSMECVKCRANENCELHIIIILIIIDNGSTHAVSSLLMRYFNQSIYNTL